MLKIISIISTISQYIKILMNNFKISNKILKYITKLYKYKIKNKIIINNNGGKNMVNPIIAAIISFFLPGIGQIIQGADVKKGIIMFIIAIVLSYLLMNFLGSLGNIIYLLYAIYAAYDAYKIEV